MNAKLVQIGNSRGVRLPRAAIEKAGLKDDLELEVRDGSIVIRPKKTLREGWREAAKLCHELGEDKLLIDVPTDFDASWEWK